MEFAKWKRWEETQNYPVTWQKLNGKSLGLVLREGLQWRERVSPDLTSLGINLTYIEWKVISQPRANARPNKRTAEAGGFLWTDTRKASPPLATVALQLPYSSVFGGERPMSLRCACSFLPGLPNWTVSRKREYLELWASTELCCMK